jgi:hypothetical protein
VSVASPLAPGWLVPPADANDLAEHVWPAAARRRDDGQLELGGVAVRDLVAQYGTPVLVLGDPGQWQRHCAAVLEAGPTPLTHGERQWARYCLTDLLDDLIHATDPGEQTVIAATAWTTAAHQALALSDHWIGSGKWLLRELRDLDQRLADRWLAAHGNAAAIGSLIRDILDHHGGPLFDGYHVPGERPPHDNDLPSVVTPTPATNT